MGQPELAQEIPSGERVYKEVQKNVTGEFSPSSNWGGRLGESGGELAAYGFPTSPITSIPSAVGLGVKSLLGAGGGMAAKSVAEGTPYEVPAEIAGTVLAPGAAAKTTEAALKGTGRIVGGVLSGAGQNVPAQAFKAGAAGGAEWDTFVKNMRTRLPPEQIVDEANRAVGNLFRSRSANYEAGVQKLENNPHFVGFSGADKGLQETADVGRIRGITTNPGAAAVHDEISNLVDQWKSMVRQEPTIVNERGIHDLKRAVGTIRDRFDGVEGKGAEYHIADRVYHNIQDSISRASPLYKKMTEDWASSSQELGQLQKTFSLRGPETNTDSALRKLLSVVRDEANTNYGARANLATVLEQNGAPNLGAAVAGQAAKAWLPRGLARLGAEGIGGAGITAAGLTLHPGGFAGLGLLPLTSPRLVGETAGGLGRMAGYLGLPEGFAEAKSTGQMKKNLIAALMKQSAEPDHPILANLARVAKSLVTRQQ
jgi:hypothetical protein